MSEVFEIVRNKISQQSDTDKSEIILDTELHGDLGLDSLDAVDLAIDIEDMFKFSITEPALSEFCECRTVGDLVSFVEAHIS